MIRRFGLGFLVASLALQPVFAQLPDLGDVSQAGLSPAKEKRVGELIMRDIRQHESTYIDDPEIDYYLNSLGDRLVAAAGLTPSDFEFFALRESSINAFAFYGGHVAIHSGLLTTTANESELAGVMSHEIGHIQQRHLARQMEKQANATAMVLASFVVALLAGSRGNSGGDIAQAAIASGQAAAIQSQLSFSQDFEREADRMGFQTLQAAGFDVQGMVSFFDRLSKATRGSERPDTAYLRTHPLSSDRMADMQGRAQNIAPRQVADSNEYVLVRAKMEAEVGTPRDTLQKLQLRAAPRRQDQAALLYATARLALRARNPADAAKALEKLRAMRFEAPMIEQLAADIARAQDKHAEAAKICQAGLQRYPAARYLMLSESEALLADGQAEKVAMMTRDALVDSPKDEHLYALQAKAYAAMGRTVDQQRALAELYVLQGNLLAAIEQLRLAQRSPNRDFYAQSAVEARLKELRAKEKEERANKLEF